MTGKPELVYFNGRGYGEIIRLTLAVAGIEFTEINLRTRQDFLALLPELTFQEVPLLRIDGLKLVQSRAIARYVARKAHLFGSNDIESARIDVLFDGSREFSAGFTPMVFMPEEEVKKQIKEKVLPKYLPVYDKILGDSSSGFLVGESLSLADIGLLEVLFSIVDYFGEEALLDYPNVLTFFHKLLADDKVINYKQNIRHPKNDEALVKSALEILGR